MASVLGGLVAFVLIPVTNTTEPGLRDSVSLNDLMVGCAIGILGCVGGALIRTRRIDRVVNVAESTRI